MQIIPAIDIINGKCVRLTQGDYTQMKVYNEDPVEVAKQFEDAGLQRLHLVDLDGAKAGAVKNWKVLENISRYTKLSIDFGGGIKQQSDLETVFNAGAAFATIGSLAVKSPETFKSWIDIYGAYKFLLGADVKDEKIAVSGWLETTDINLFDFITEYTSKGITQVFCTDISKDGKLEGPAVSLYEKVVNHFPDLHFIASGGVSSIEDIIQLKNIGCKGVIIGKAIYEGRITIEQLKKLF
ncbi:MAG: 1-(5-phosphoribosyl)-5-[(5-phosphoribosylamino)methylideneamino]imidazole-4-carboxamide isomerase [Chitinophagaceae bacterium]|nr:1-(5-phosphoribosyl)-5-[(5-phosphoribosylamino)methylideneamino]imidazole-4-carboxamide isomerase [Chitinophagaceae bacterium]